ncbi:SagB/ThcOx family dehydrogenase [Bdellovibrionota bacterium]
MEKIKLPTPKHESKTSLEQTLLTRRSTRSYKKEPLTLDEISQLCWAAQGVTSPEGFRTAPSAGAIFPLEFYVVCGNAKDLPAGVYKYLPKEHQLEKITDGDKRQELGVAAFNQDCVKDGAVSFVITGLYDGIIEKYGENGPMYAHMEVGHIGQNIHLQAVTLNLGTVMVAALYKDQVTKALGLPEKEDPLYIMPVGK